MQLLDLLKQSGGIDAIGRELGLSQAQASSGASALLPSILIGLQNSATGLGGLVDELGGSRLMDKVLAPEPTDAGPGDQVLGRIFGAKQDSRAVAQQAATSTGLDVAVLERMLPLLAMLATGFLASQGAGGGLGGLLGNMSGVIGGGGLSSDSPLNDLLGKPRQR